MGTSMSEAEHSYYTCADGTRLRVLKDGVLVRMDKEAKTSATGLIHIPDSAHQTILGTGEVLAFGHRELKKGRSIPLPGFEVGLKCCFIKFLKEQSHCKVLRRELEQDLVLLKARDILLMWHKDEDLQVA